jgi:DNA-binding NtrC family response regulator
MQQLRLLLVHVGKDAGAGTQGLADSDFPPRYCISRSAIPVSIDELVKAAPKIVAIEHGTDSLTTLETVRRIRSYCAILPIVLLARESSESFAIDAFHAGVTRYFRHPYTPVQIVTILDEIAAQSAPDQKHGQETGHGAIEAARSFPLVGPSASMCELRRYIQQVAPSDSNVLITGETGTGKELVAQWIHTNSQRHKQPLVSLNTAAIPDALVESELFGYEKGAFTGAQSANLGKLAAANRGTVFFDEIGDVGLPVQAKLLRAIESRKFFRLGSNRSQDLDVRILAATNQDLEAATQQSRFRSDLYYRLNVIRIEVPPLRERIEDIPDLVKDYIRRFNPVFRKNVSGLSRGAMDLLFSYQWPGNARELRNVLEAAYVSLPDRADGLVDLPIPVTRMLTRSTQYRTTERATLLRALTATNWNKTEAAKSLHWSRMTLYRKMTRYQLRSQ